MRLRHLTRLLSATAFCAACVHDTPRVRTPANVAGEYVMVERNGGRLPHRLASAPGCQTELVRDVLTLHGDGSAAEEIEGRAWCNPQPRPDTTGVSTTLGNFRLRGPRGDSIVIVMSAGAAAETMRGEIAGDEIRVTGVTEAIGLQRTYRYVRQR